MTFTPTQQQLNVLEAIKTSDILKVAAFSGSGKTSTLTLLAEANPVPSIYLAFNSDIVKEAKTKFPSHVKCQTVHSAAYGVFGKALAHKLKRAYFDRKSKPINYCMTVTEIANYFSIPDFYITEEDVLTGKAIAALTKQTVSNYQYSADTNIEVKHIALKKSAFEEDVFKRLTNTVLTYANMLWKERTDVSSIVLCEHDTYLKLWQLSNPKLNYDIIYVDESQDVNPVIFQVVKQQTHCKIVYVGDSYQSIYAFRKAVNAMEKIDAPVVPLSTSFRFGQEIADIANFIIQSDISIQGNPNKKSLILEEYELPSQYTMIFRTNAALIGKAVFLTLNGVKVKCQVDTYEFEKQLKSVDALYKGDMKNIKDETVVLYSNWEDFIENIKEHQEFKRMVNIVQSNKVKMYLDALVKMRDNKSKYDVLLITAHKSKGMEWDTVVIADDFPMQNILLPKGEKGYLQQEVNLFYVACTRAIKGIRLPQDFYQAYLAHRESLDYLND